MQLTVKQIALMKAIGKPNEDGSHRDLDQVLEELSYKTTKASLQFSIRALVKHGLIEKLGTETRRGRSRQCLSVTEKGRPYANMHGWGTPGIVETEEEDLGFALEPTALVFHF